MSLAPLSISSTARSMRFGAPAIMSSVRGTSTPFSRMLARSKVL